MDLENMSEIIKCIRLLLDYGASPNIPDDNFMLPLRNVLKKNLTRNQKSELVSMFLQYPNLDIDSFGGSLRKALLEFDANLNLPAVRENADKEVNYHNLLYSMDKDIPLFKEMLPKFKEDKSKLLVESITKGYNEALEILLLQSDLDINEPHYELFFLTFVEYACTVGHWFALEQLLKHEKLVITKDMDVLNPLIYRLDKPASEFTNYVKCFELVLASKYSRLHERDGIGRTPLHKAIYFHHDVAVKKLLQSGAYLGMRSDCKQLAVQDIKPELLEQHLDSCITSSSHSRGHDAYEIQLNYINFRLRGDSGLASEMQLICEMGKFAALRPLLQHPLISSFIMLKWHSLSRIFYIHFMFYVLSSICLLTHLMLNYTAKKTDSVVTLFNVLSVIGLSYIALCELIGLSYCLSYSALVIAFALSFYVLNLHQLNSKGLIEVFIRTVIMSTGEFNANEIEGNIYVNLFFLLFVILISIVLMNLLTALAIGDTQVIQAEAEVNTLICRARLLSAYEIFLSESWG
ncbi:transient receptor potential cation channel protein painless-like [Drosophila busckii]|uniref:transient receptor potential cation channel protein painless-like n=1 Tax=Drosophila busckii TaxID=30019 RepID=UPI0014330907|nr:transient receptor potential cation channel protein painless-like [Drosophila busckii]